jgi:predicted nucleic acid-binding protein
MIQMTRVLTDTSAWIDFFKSKTGDLGNLVTELIETNQAAITGVIIAELLQGVKQENGSQRLRVLFRSVFYVQ